MPILTIAAAACCLLSGNVHSSAGVPVANARISLLGTSVTTVESNATGSFSITLPRGQYQFQASASGYTPASIGSLTIDHDTRFDVTLKPLNSPEFRIIGSVRVDGKLALPRDVAPSADINRSDMERLGYDRVVNALAAVPSLTFAHPGGGASTAPTVVALRGPDPSETLVTLDTQVLNDANTGDLDLACFPVAAFSNVAITEGLGPSDSGGSNTIGGAVNIVSLAPTRAPHTALSLSTGSFGGSEAWFNATGSHSKFGYAAAFDDQQEHGYVDQNVVLCQGGYNPTLAQPCAAPAATHLASNVSSHGALAHLTWTFSQRADLALRAFSLNDSRDRSGVLNTPADPSVAGAGDFFTGPGSAAMTQTIRAYELRGRAPLGTGSLLADLTASNNLVNLTGTGTTPYDVTHQDKRQTLALSWQRSLVNSELAVGGYLRGESLIADGVNGTQTQQIASYFVRGAIRPTSKLRVSAAAYVSHYSTFGSNLDGRIGLLYDLAPSSVLRFSIGTGFRAPLLIERYVFPVDQLVLDQNCVALGQGNPNEKPEHATEYELGYAHRFASVATLDASLYRTNLRDPIENFYPLGTTCPAKNPPLQSFPINVGNVVYQGAELRFLRRFEHLSLTAQYGLNVAYPRNLPAFVANPTSGANLVEHQQFLGIPQQAASLGLDWSNNDWHAALQTIARGKNNELHQGPFAMVNAALGFGMGKLDLTLAATNLTNAVAGRFTLAGLGEPYRGITGQTTSGAPIFGQLPTDRFFVEPLALRLVVTLRR